MKIHEYQARDILMRHGIPAPAAEVASTPAEARAAAEKLGVPTVVKAQVLVGGRGKAGGVKLATTPQDAEIAAKAILGMDIKGNTVEKVLVAEATKIAKEIYLGIVVDRSAKRVTLMASAEGGVEIEEVARVSPEKIIKVSVHPMLGLQEYQARDLAFGIGLDASLVRDFAKITKCLYHAFVDSDASLAEINPLVITADGKLLALDSKMLLDDNALFRHTGFEELRDPSEETEAERIGRQQGFSYVKLDGAIGCMVNGAGLAMATMDVIELYGGEPANFLDVGGGAKSDRVAEAFRLLLSDKNVKAVLLNIFGGITRCDEVAKGIVEALQKVKCDLPIVVRLVGTNEEQGREILAQAGFSSTTSMNEAAQMVVARAYGR
ncbi:MAG: ADP-forming succinate--CoA ligase subunit beta [Chloroflexi bacterium]|nr:ADP-forming succinate--CoA ligase subunit beta [Chloroflexota bacterium]MDA8188252.1 ADP-forming succinate--CoA ligase subunit beta [Dehalococcoidales bacterium]